MSSSDNDLKWLDARIKERKTASRNNERARFDPNLPVIDAGLFSQQIADIAERCGIRSNAKGLQFFPTRI